MKAITLLAILMIFANASAWSQRSLVVDGVEFRPSLSKNSYSLTLAHEWHESVAQAPSSSLPFQGNYEKFQDFIVNNRDRYAIIEHYWYPGSGMSQIAHGTCDWSNGEFSNIAKYQLEFDKPVLFIDIWMSSSSWGIREHLKQSELFLGNLDELGVDARSEFLKEQPESVSNPGRSQIARTHMGQTSFFVAHLPDGKRRVMSFWKSDLDHSLQALRETISKSTLLGVSLDRHFKRLASDKIFGSELSGQTETFAQNGLLNLQTDFVAYLNERSIKTIVSDYGNEPDPIYGDDGYTRFQHDILQDLPSTAWSCDLKTANKWHDELIERDRAYNQRLLSELSAVNNNFCLQDTVLDIYGHVSC